MAELPGIFDLTPMNPNFNDDPHKLLDRLRTECPVHRDERAGSFVLTRYADVRRVLSDTTMWRGPERAEEGAVMARALLRQRAEGLTTPEDDQPALAATTWPPLESSEATRVPAVDNPAPASETTAASESVTAPAQGWTMAMRWPESNTAAPQAASAAGEQTAAALRANAAPQEATIDPLRIALIVLTAVLLAAAIAGRLLLRQVRRRPRRTKSRAIWPDQRSDDQIPATVLPSATIRRRGQPLHAPLDTQRTNADVEEIEALLRASRSATG